MRDLRTTVVVVNYNSREHLRGCLGALRSQTAHHSVVVIDNASTDGLIAPLARDHPEVRFLPLRRNVGLARAVNIAARASEPTTDVLVTLNPDTVPDPNFIEQLTLPFDDPTVSSTAGTLVFATRPEIVASAGIRVFGNGVAIDAHLGATLSGTEQATEVFGASGGAAAYRLRAFQEAGGFCDAFFLYLEDVDLAWRLRLLGGRSIWAPAAVATHAYSASSIEGSAFKRRKLSRNRIWTLARCLPTEVWKRYRMQILMFDARAMAWAMTKGDTALLRGRSEALALLPARLCERREIQRAIAISLPEITRWIEPALPDRELLRLRRLTSALAK